MFPHNGAKTDTDHYISELITVTRQGASLNCAAEGRVFSRRLPLLVFISTFFTLISQIVRWLVFRLLWVGLSPSPSVRLFLFSLQAYNFRHLFYCRFFMSGLQCFMMRCVAAGLWCGPHAADTAHWRFFHPFTIHPFNHLYVVASLLISGLD